MAVYRKNPAKSALTVSMKFRTYNEAVQFSRASGMLHASKPFKRTGFKDGEQVIYWCVSMPNMNPLDSGSYEQLSKDEAAKALADKVKSLEAALTQAQQKPIKSKAKPRHLRLAA